VETAANGQTRTSTGNAGRSGRARSNSIPTYEDITKQKQFAENATGEKIDALAFGSMPLGVQSVIVQPKQDGVNNAHMTAAVASTNGSGDAAVSTPPPVMATIEAPLPTGSSNASSEVEGGVYQQSSDHSGLEVIASVVQSVNVGSDPLSIQVAGEPSNIPSTIEVTTRGSDTAIAPSQPAEVS
jgi:hypothetical protein